ncbi:ubiquitin-like protein 3 [Lepus europaeus]|uniref:ubiquitin-like protein 3 n=1 Tax=Lepus europaeus TaxID=9983 RepID=UPI002B477C98|nr:ubiquitin-like protein 3 [Lepus europaeus]
MINLCLILVSGKTKEFLFSPKDFASAIAKRVYDNWPVDSEDAQVSSPNIPFYQGRFLHGNVTLGTLKLPFGKRTVMHLVARETLWEPNSQDQRNREKTGKSDCCVILWAAGSGCHAARTGEASGSRDLAAQPTCASQSRTTARTLSSLLMKLKRTRDILHYLFFNFLHYCLC